MWWLIFIYSAYSYSAYITSLHESQLSKVLRIAVFDMIGCKMSAVIKKIHPLYLSHVRFCLNGFINTLLLSALLLLHWELLICCSYLLLIVLLSVTLTLWVYTFLGSCCSVVLFTLQPQNIWKRRRVPDYITAVQFVWLIL